MNQGHCTGCHMLRRIRKDELVGQHRHPVTGEECPGVGEKPMETTPLTALHLRKQLREVVQVVRARPEWQQETAAATALNAALAPRIEHLEAELSRLRAENAMLADTVVSAAALWFEEIPEGSPEHGAASEDLHLTAEELKRNNPRLRGT